MNVKKAIETLLKYKSQRGIQSIEKVGNKYHVKYNFTILGAPSIHEYSARELIKFARVYTSDNEQHTAIKTSLKTNSKKNRTKVRDAIKTESFDDIPQNGEMFKDDIWNYT